jgi:hypothetical protein
MQLNVSEPVPLPADEVLILLRDDMPKLVPYLYDIDRIEVTERREEGDVVHIVNLWFGDVTKVPGPIRKVARPDLFSWTDYASWTGETRRATWRLEPRVGARAFECSGHTTIVDTGETARIDMEINLDIHPENIPGIPKFLARKFLPQIERAVEKQITPNLRNLAASIRRYAEATGRV